MTTLTDTMTWRVETSHLIHHPDAFAVDSMAELRRRIQSLADARSTTERSFGELSYRYELDERRDEAVVMHCYFDNRHNKRQRFMRLRREL